MSFASRFNKGSIFNIDTKDLPFKSVKDMYGKGQFPMRGFYFSKKGNYGEQVVLISDKFLLNCPKHMCSTFHDIAVDGEAIDDIKAGKVAVEISEPYTSHGKECYSVVFVDVK